jgi:hypothetical protein
LFAGVVDESKLWEGKMVMKESEERVRSWDVGEVSPARKSVWRFSGRREKSLVLIWMRGIVGLLWRTSDWIQAKAIELMMESRSEVGLGSILSEQGEMYAPPALLPITIVQSPPLEGDTCMLERYRSFDK